MQQKMTRKITFIKILLIVIVLTNLKCSASSPQQNESDSNSSSPDYQHTKKQISMLIQKKLEGQKLMGLSLALVDDQQIVWADGFGFADKENNIPATAETVYMMGSISKLFTATAVMQLAEQGKIDIDQPLQTYLPEFSIKTRFPDDGPITPRNIMTHHSGLPSDWAQGMLSNDTTRFPGFKNTHTELAKKLNHEYTASPPNFAFSYSNLGFSLLGHMLSNLHDDHFISVMDQTMLQPLGMTRSAFWPTKDIKPFVSKTYRSGERTKPVWGRDLPAGALHSTANDMSRFMMMVFANGKAGDNQIIKPEILEEMLSYQNSDVARDMDFRIGLSWFLDMTGNKLSHAGKVALHSGGIGRFQSILITLPEHKLGVVIMSNSGHTSFITKTAIETLQFALEEKTGLTYTKQEPSPIISLSQQELKKIEGHYGTSMGMMSFQVKGNKLKGEFLGRSFRVIPHANGKFSLKYLMLGIFPVNIGQMESIRLAFAKAEGQRVIGFYQDGMIMGAGEKFQPGPIPEAWIKRLGDYEIIDSEDDFNPITDFKIQNDKGLFMLNLNVYGQNVSVPLKAISNSDVITVGLGRNMGETIRVIIKDNEERLFYSGYELRKKIN